MKTLALILMTGLALPALGHAAAKTDFVVKTEMHDVNLWDGAGRLGHTTQMFINRYEEVYVTGRPKQLANGETWLPVKIRRMNEDGTFDTPRGWVDAKFFRRVGGADDDASTEGRARGHCTNCGPHHGLGALPTVATGAKTSARGFRWPVGGIIRSGFGMRFHPMLKHNHFHAGIDIAGNNRRPVGAAKAGKVILSRGGCGEARSGATQYCNGRAGNWLIIDHGDGTQTNYMHLSPTCRLPKAGTVVQAGQKIGCVGMSGGATGPHLHFGVKVKRNGKFVDVDPMLYLPRKP